MPIKLAVVNILARSGMAAVILYLHYETTLVSAGWTGKTFDFIFAP